MTNFINKIRVLRAEFDMYIRLRVCVLSFSNHTQHVM